MRVACAPMGTPRPASDLPFALYGYPSSAAEGSAGPAVPAVIRRLGMRPPARAWDFLSIALSVIAADEGCSRSRSPDGWGRSIELSVAVVDRPFWESQAGAIAQALAFLTTHQWELSFTDGGFLPAPPARPKPRPEQCACLLSGGLDSLVGAIDLVRAGRIPVLVSQIAKGDKRTQRALAAALGNGGLHLQLNHNARPPGPSERSQRARSLIFLAYGVLAASSLDRHGAGEVIDLYVPENGFISLNVPLTPLRVGSLSTRTTHPFYLHRIQAVLDDAQLRVRLTNPYQFMTKGEMLATCRDQALLSRHAGQTTSCGRYARTGFQHCGRCVPCMIRRAAFQRWGQPDTTPGYRYTALATPGPRHRDFDDVRSVAVAIETVRRQGFDAWVGGALNGVQLGGDVTRYKDVAQRGLSELEAFFRSSGVL
jgi:hypothetical protein